MTETNETPVEETVIEDDIVEVPASDSPLVTPVCFVNPTDPAVDTDFQVNAGGLVPGLLVNVVVISAAGVQAQLVHAGDDGSVSVSFHAFTAGGGTADIRDGNNVICLTGFTIAG